MTLVSPWVYTATDYQGKTLSVSITFSNAILTIVSAVTRKDPGCLYSNVYFGLGGDGAPDSSGMQIAVPDGDGVVLLTLLNGFGFLLISDILAVQVTAGP